MKQSTVKNILKTISTIAFIALVGCETNPADSSDNNNTNTSANKDYLLVIPEGAQSVKLGAAQSRETIHYTAKLLSANGDYIDAQVNWSTTDSSIISINASGMVSIKKNGATSITATATFEGNSYSATVPLSVYLPSTWIVSPSALIGSAGESHELETVVFSIGNTGLTFSYTSANSNIASVNSSGTVTLIARGNTIITVTDNNNNIFSIPVVVVEPPKIDLPVTRLSITPGNKTLFRNDTFQFTAQAFNSDNAEVSPLIIWSSNDNSVVTIDHNGLATATGLGETVIKAVSEGIVTHASVVVYPDTIIVINPFLVTKGPGETQQLTATAYNARTQTAINEITQFTWFIPQWADLHSSLSILDIATINASGLLTIKNNALPGLSTPIFASIVGSTTALGAAAVIVDLGIIDIPLF